MLYEIMFSISFAKWLSFPTLVNTSSNDTLLCFCNSVKLFCGPKQMIYIRQVDSYLARKIDRSINLEARAVRCPTGSHSLLKVSDLMK